MATIKIKEADSKRKSGFYMHLFTCDCKFKNFNVYSLRCPKCLSPVYSNAYYSYFFDIKSDSFVTSITWLVLIAIRNNSSNRVSNMFFYNDFMRVLDE